MFDSQFVMKGAFKNDLVNFQTKKTHYNLFDTS